MRQIARCDGTTAFILEADALLNAQTALANMQQQRIQALADWRAVRLRLAGSLGRLGTPDMQ